MNNMTSVFSSWIQRSRSVWNRFAWTERLLLLAIFLIPFDGRWRFAVVSSRLYGEVGAYLVPELYFSDFVILAWLVCLGWQRWSARRNGWMAKRLNGWDKTALLGFGLLMVGGIWAGGQSFFPEIALYRLVRLCFYSLWAVALARTHWHRLLATAASAAFVAAAVFQSLLGWLQVVFQHSITWGKFANLIGESPLDHYIPGINFIRLNGHKIIRPYGTTDHPNLLAGYLLIVVLVAGYFLLVSYREKVNGQMAKSRLFGGQGLNSLWGALCFLLLTIGLTLSRTAWGVLIVWGMVWGMSREIQIVKWLNGSIHRSWLRVALILGGLVIGTVGVPRVVSLFNVNQISFSGRLMLNGYALQMISDHPLGVGPGHFTLLLNYYDLTGFFDSFRQPVHQVFLLVGAEFGLIGLLGLLMVQGGVVGGLIAKLKRPDERGLIPRVFLLAWVGLLLTMFFDHYLWTLHTGQLILWGVTGLSVAVIRAQSVV